MRRVFESRSVQRRGSASRLLRLAGSVVVLELCVLSGCGDGAEVSGPGAPPAATPGKVAKTLALRLEEENHSGAFGTATITGDDHAISVSLQVEPAGRSYHAHIHDVSCTEYRRMTSFSKQLATVAEGLSDVVDGESTTDVAVPLSRYAKPGFSINVHKFAAPYPVIACGDIPAP